MDFAILVLCFDVAGMLDCIGGIFVFLPRSNQPGVVLRETGHNKTETVVLQAKDLAAGFTTLPVRYQ